jgi:hypothetical protein
MNNWHLLDIIWQNFPSMYWLERCSSKTFYTSYIAPPPQKKKKKRRKKKRKLTKHPGLNPRVIIFGSTVLVRHSLVQQCQEVVDASVLFRSSYLVYCVRFFCLKVSACLWEVLIFRFCIITNFFNLGSSSHFWNWNGHQRRIQGVPPPPPKFEFYLEPLFNLYNF